MPRQKKCDTAKVEAALDHLAAQVSRHKLDQETLLSMVLGCREALVRNLAWPFKRDDQSPEEWDQAFMSNYTDTYYRNEGRERGEGA